MKASEGSTEPWSNDGGTRHVLVGRTGAGQPIGADGLATVEGKYVVRIYPGDELQVRVAGEREAQSLNMDPYDPVVVIYRGQDDEKSAGIRELYPTSRITLRHGAATRA